MKRRHARHFSAWQAYSDMLLNMLSYMLLVVFLLLIVVHTPQPKTAQQKRSAQYLVTLRWDDMRDVDLDLWLRDPAGHVIYYYNREAPNISLDRDSRGYLSNRTVLPNGKVTISPNQEIIAIRAVIPGNYLVAVDYYQGDGPIDAHLDVQKVNPVVTTVFHGDVHLQAQSDAKNVVAFHIAADGKITVIPTPPENLVYTHLVEQQQ